MAKIVTPNANSPKRLVQIIKQMVCEHLQKEAYNIWVQHDLS